MFGNERLNAFPKSVGYVKVSHCYTSEKQHYNREKTKGIEQKLFLGYALKECFELQLDGKITTLDEALEWVKSGCSTLPERQKEED